MKKYAILTLMCFLGLSMQAQKVIEKTLNYNNQVIDLDVKFAHNIEVKTWDKQSVYFKANLTMKDSKYLELYELDIDESSGSIEITSKPEPIFKKVQEEWKKKSSGKEEHYSWGDNEYQFDYILYVPKNARFKVSSINGNLASEIIEGQFEADLINGDIEIANYAGNFDLKTINGAIDLKMINANLKAETIHGDIYVDEKLNFKSTEKYVGQTISGQTAEGKNRLRLNTINGNMYLRL